MARTTSTKAIVLALLAASLSGAAPVAEAANPGGVASAEPSTAAPAAGVHAAALATWFGPGFYGRTTACGQTLTPSTIGVANRTLPCGTLVKVSYRGRHLTVPVIDRGPYGNGAAWDLTTEAARTLGIEETVRIGARVVGSTPNTPTLGLPPGSALDLPPASSPATAVIAGGAAAGGAAAG